MPVRTISLPIQGLDDHDSVAIDDIYVSNLRNVRSDRSRIVQSPGGTLLAPVPYAGSSAAPGVSSGLFTKITTTGMQTVNHGLNTTPVALILFTVGNQVLNSAENSYYWSVGFTDGTSSRSRSASSLNGTPPSTSRGYALKLLSLVSAGSVIDECDWSSWNSTTFTINWTTSETTLARQIGFIALGAPGLSARVLEWTYGTATGNQAITGVGFKPDLLIHIHTNQAASGVVTDSQFGIGAMATSGQWANCFASPNGVTPNRGIAARKKDHGLLMLNTTGAAYTYDASLVSLDADGFTINRAVSPGSGVTIATLCLKGFTNLKVGSYEIASSMTPETRQLIDVGFQPSGGIFSVVPIGTGMFETNNNNCFVGSADAVLNNVSACMTEDNGGSAVVVETRSDSCKIDVSNVGTVDSRFNVKSWDGAGFTAYIPEGNFPGIFTDYVLMGFPAITQTLGVIRNYGDIIIGGSTPAEKIVMLTSKTASVYAPATQSTGNWTVSGEVYTGTDIQRFSIANGTDSSGALAAWSQGTDNVRKYDGTVFTSLITSGTNHAARVVLAFNNRIVTVRPFFGGIDHKTQIRWSINGGFSDFAGTGSGTLEVVETSNQPLTSGIVLGPRCYLTRAREVIELIATGSLSPVFIPQPVVSGIGCIATHSMAAGDIYAFWLGPDEVYQWDGSQLKAVGGRTYNTITKLVDYEHLDQIQATVYEPDSQYWLLVPPYIFVYDYRRDIWDWDDTRSYQAIGRLSVADLFTANIGHSEFIVIGDSSVQTIREDPSINTYLGSPIDSYFETKDFVPLDQRGRNFEVAYDKYNSLWRVWFRGTPGEVIEVGVSIDKGLSYPFTQIVTVNAAGVGIAFFDVAWGVMRIRIRSQAGSAYLIAGPIQYEFGVSGVMLP
jgi:hypothetical protein